MEGSHIGKRKKLKSKKKTLRNNKDCWTKEERTEEEVSSGRSKGKE
jgi:hypothetical protein